MPKFIQIGNKGIAVEHITDLLFREGKVTIGLDVKYAEGQAYITLAGNDSDLFLHWWENIAEVYVLSDCPACRQGVEFGPKHLEDCAHYCPF